MKKYLSLNKIFVASVMCAGALGFLLPSHGFAKTEDVYPSKGIIPLLSKHKEKDKLPLYKTASQPLDLVRDSFGNIFTANIGNNTITKITPSGAPVDAAGYPSLVFAQTGNAPMAIAIDSNDNIYTVNSADHTVTKVKPNGTTTLFATIHPSMMDSLAIDSNNNLYIGDQTNNTITKITPNGVVVFNFASAGSYVPTDIAIDSQDNLFVISGNDIIKIDSVTGTSVLFASLNMNPISLAIDSTDNIYALGSMPATIPVTYEIKIITTSGFVIDWFSPIQAFAKDITLDVMDNVYVSVSPNAMLPGYVLKIDQSNTPTASVYGVTGKDPWGILVSPTGSVYTANVWSNSVTKL